MLLSYLERVGRICLRMINKRKDVFILKFSIYLFKKDLYIFILSVWPNCQFESHQIYTIKYLQFVYIEIIQASYTTLDVSIKLSEIY